MKSLKHSSLLIITAFFFLACCSKDGSVIATYNDGVKTYSVTIGDIKNNILPYVVNNPSIISNTGWHRDFIFDSYLTRNLVFLEKAKTGFTNIPGFKTDFDLEYYKNNLLLLYQKGEESIKSSAKNERYDAAHTAHILLLASRFTNIIKPVAGFTNIYRTKKAITNFQEKQIILSDKDYDNLIKSKQMAALNIIDSLKKSKDIEKEFAKTAAVLSEDHTTASNGGDNGFIPQGYMAKEYEDAAFSAGKSGLLDKPVLTTSGYYIIYIKSPHQKKSLDEIKNSEGKDLFKRLESFYGNSFLDRIKKENIKDAYTPDYTNKTLIIDGKTYKPAQLPPDLVLVNIFGQPKTWKDCQGFILLYVPDFNSNITFESFILQMQNYKNFAFVLGTAKKQGVEKDPSFLKELEKSKDSITKNLSVQVFEKELLTKAEALLTPEAKKDYYNKYKARFITNIGGKIVQLSYNQAEHQIAERLKGDLFRQNYDQWKESIIKQYNVIYNDNGFKDLYSLEAVEYSAQSKLMRKK